MARKPIPPRNAVLFHHPDAVDTGRAKLMGRHAAGEGLLRGFVRHSGVEAFHAHTVTREHFDDFTRRVGAIDTERRPCRQVLLGEMAASDLGTLMFTDPAMGPFAWRRRMIGGRAYSLCGLTHTLSSEIATDTLAELMTAPMQPWDALICTSDAVRITVEGLLERWTDYLNHRTGGRLRPMIQLPVIPLGVDCDAFERSEATEFERQHIRRRLGIDDGDMAVLYLGRLSFHAKAHPAPMYLSLEEASRRTGKRIHLIQAGWFANENIEREIRAGARDLAPSVNAIFLDGREADVRQKVWFAADVFSSFSDNIQETFGLAPLEAMAAGLPVVVSDWDGYRDTVRPGIDGFTVPTWMPMAQSGGDLALAPESRFAPEADEISYDRHLGTVSQFTAVDVGAATDAFSTLARDPGLRRRMSEAAAKRARDTFDWRVVIAAYQALWRELENIRNREHEIAPATRDRSALPLRDDPFSVYAAYPSHSVDGKTMVALAGGDGDEAAANDWRDRLTSVTRHRMNIFAADAMLGTDDQEAVLTRLANEGPLSVYALAELLAEDRRYLLTRTVVWLAKMGLVGLTPSKDSQRDDRPGGQSAGGPRTALVDLGIAARRRGAFGVAARYFRRALENAPDDPVANNQLGELMAFAHNLGEAKDSFERAIAQTPDYHPAHRNLGRVRFLQGDYAAATGALARAAEIMPKDAETMYLLGVCCRYEGAHEDARRHLQAALDIDGARTDALAHLGLVETAIGNDDAARTRFQSVLERDAGHVLARAALVNIEARTRDGGANQRMGGKRVGLYVHAKHHFALLNPLFEAFADDHLPYISADLRDLADFTPDTVVLCDAPIDRIRSQVPDAVTVNVRQGLAERNFARRTSRHADYVCAAGPEMRDRLIASKAFDPERVWSTGYPGTDPIFKAAAGPKPDAGRQDRRMVLYAPTHHAAFSSAPMLGDRAAALIGGTRDDITIVIKPHPLICEYRPRWMAAWAQIAARDPHVHLVRDPTADITPMLIAADVLVSDSSGVIFQYLPLDRPMVLITNPERDRDGEHFDAEAIEWRWRDVGEEVLDVDDLPAAVGRALDDPARDGEARARYRERLFGELTDGHAAERIVDNVGAL